MRNKFKFSDYLPLITALLLVSLFTYISVLNFSKDFMAALMGWFFLFFGLAKIFSLRSFVVAFQRYDLIAMKSKTYAYAFPFLEIGAGLAYLYSWNIVIVSAIFLPFLIIGSLSMFIKIYRNDIVPCVCLGTVFMVPMSWFTLAEDIFMVAMVAMFLF
jgi:hypothetical protein